MSGSDRTRVVVTGMGCLSPLGCDLETTWSGAVDGRSGIGPITRFDPAQHASRIAGQLPGEPDLGDMPPREARRLDPFAAYAVAAARAALEDAAWSADAVDLDRVGVAVGTGIGGIQTLSQYDRVLVERGPRKVTPFLIPMVIGNIASGLISMQHGLRGPNLCHVSACATASHGIGEAARMIQRGDADAMLAGGTEAPVTDLGVAGFAAMRALSTRNDEPERASRPFDRGRDGFVMGEGAGVLLLESLAHAQARGARIRAEVAGYGASADAAHLTLPDPTGDGARRCLQAALRDAGVSPGEVDYINAHATSTPSGDPVEATAIRAVFGEYTDALPVSATKSMTGHLLGAAGAVETIFCVRALETGLLPPTINLEDPDPECPLNHVAGKAREARVRVAVNNSFGFGGTNAALVLRAWDES